MKNKIISIVYSMILGIIIGFIVWSFMKLMNFGIDFFWGYVPNNFDIPFYTIIVCVLGGIIIGLCKMGKKEYPEDLNIVIKKIKKDDKYSYRNFGQMYLFSILPLIFGASVGPESGLVGIISALCSWIKDKFKFLFKEINDLTSIGMSATLATIFNAPMFGFVEPIENEDNVIPKTSKLVLYFTSILSAMGIIFLLRYIFGGSSGLEGISGYVFSIKESLLLIPLTIIGCILGIIYNLFERLTSIVSSKIKNILIKCIICGLVLGILGTIFPLVMFSGELQIENVIHHYENIGIITLLLVGFIKLFITPVCVNLGFKGGHFFPVIFSGVCIGCSLGLLFNINIAFSICVVTTTLMSFILKKPLASVLLLMLIFRVSSLPIMLLAAIIGSFISNLIGVKYAKE